MGEKGGGEKRGIHIRPRKKKRDRTVEEEGARLIMRRNTLEESKSIADPIGSCSRKL